MRAKYEHVDLSGQQSLAVLDIDLESFDAAWHFHPEVELTYISEGSGERFVGESIRPFEAGDLVLLGTNTPHYWRSQPEQGTRAKATVFQFYESIADSFPEFESVSKMLKRTAVGGLKFARTDRLENGISAVSRSTGPARIVALLELLYQLEQTAPERLSLVENDRGVDMKANHRISRATEFVHLNLANAELSLPLVAKATGMTPSAFSRYFHRVTGNTLNRFIASKRVAHACKLLTDTDQSITDVAIDSGFGSLSSFNRQFKRLQEISPREFRDKHRC